MTKLFSTAALAFGLLVSGPVFAGTVEKLSHAGIDYEYTVTEKGATRVIVGYDKTNRRAFTLRVARGWVEGHVDGQPVSFRVRDVKPLTGVATVTQVAVR
jgi:hypothetical protein